MMRLKLIATALLLAPSSAFALCGNTNPTQFGLLAQATFGGTGIPNNSVVFLTNSCSNTTMGLTATPRFSSPALSNNGVSTFHANPGFDSSAPGTYAQWNFDFYVGGPNTSGLFYTLMMDLDPSAGTNFLAYDFSGNNQNSWNIGMGFYGPGGVGPGNPTVAGVYDYKLIEWQDAAHVRQIGEVDMTVDVGTITTAAPEPASIVLMTTGFVGIGAFARRRRRSV